MSIVQSCPYDINGEHCKYEIYYGEPIFSKCKNCSRTIFKRGVEMKDEEMAKEWFNKELYLESSMYNMQIEYYCKQAFLAGLKAGRTQWHDLRKDKNDLPKFRRNILVTCEYRSKLKKKRETFEWDYNSEMPLHVIAWCEIPTFDKE